MYSTKIINVSVPNTHLQNTFHKELRISKILAQVLVNRGILTLEAARKFLDVKASDLHDPFLFKDMQAAVKLVKDTIKNNQKMMIFGDYDVDGVTSVAILENTLSGMGAKVSHYLPHRVNEGYGLSKSILSIARDNNIKLLITVDCGTSSHKEIAQLRHAGIEVIITDHHEPSQDQAPLASAVINPKIKGSGYKFRDLAGVGVAYKFCQALTGKNLTDDLDLVSLGTIADMVPLFDENRIIAKLGLAKFLETKKLGLKTLIENAGIKNKKFNSSYIGYIIGPRINASGRMDTSETSLKLLTTTSQAQAEALASEVEGHNRRRQKVESQIIEEAYAIIEREVNFKEHKIIVVANEGWHHGVLGVVASKIADKFYRPTIVISKTAGAACKGSGRSIKNFHLFYALSECREFLDNFGGHSHAVGLVITDDKIDDFRIKINNFAKDNLRFEDLIPSIQVDMEIKFADLNEKLVRELELLEPFGTGNPQSQFITRNLKIKGQPAILAKDTIKFWATDGENTFQVIGFGKSPLAGSLINADSFDLIYSPKIDSWQGANGIILEAEEIILK